ncbi:MAG TPA: hypothetical protein VEO54_15515 [Thermoanaerobaculia bacterium]|nr:hypothetical protein [Thermoanaerobaculia bacterium]
MNLSKSIFALLVIVFAIVLRADEPPAFKGLEKLPDPATGEIDGQPAIVVWPVDKESITLLDPKDCRVILERHDTAEFRYLTYPCGQWFVPDIARYDMWVEGPGYVSDTASVYAFGGGKFQGNGARSLHTVVPAGTVRLKAGAAVPPGAETFRLLSLRDQWVTFQRVVAPGEAAKGVRAPAGRLVAGFFDKAGHALTLTRPFEVKAGAITDFSPAPANGNDLLMVVAKHGPSEKAPRPGLKVSAHSGGKDRAPDVLLDGRDQLIAVWYGLTGARATVTASPYFVQPQAVALRSHAPVTLRRTYDPPPIKK